MVNHFFQRLALITGADVLQRLEHTRVMVCGLGGVGSWCAEAHVRSGVGNICIVDFDTVCTGNVNRQIQATSRTIGSAKAEVLKERLLEINPCCKVNARTEKFSREKTDDFDLETMCYVIDAIDILADKLDLIEACMAADVTLFSSMGMAQKMDPQRIKVSCIWETQGCPLARLVRNGLRKRGCQGDFFVVYSDERLPRHDECLDEEQSNGKFINGSAVTVTASAGMALASLVLRDVMGKQA